MHCCPSYLSCYSSTSYKCIKVIVLWGVTQCSVVSRILKTEEAGSLKLWYFCTGLNGVTFQKTVNLTCIAISTSNLMC